MDANKDLSIPGEHDERPTEANDDRPSLELTGSQDSIFLVAKALINFASLGYDQLMAREFGL